MSSAEFAEWVAWDRISPIGEERADIRTAQVVSTMVNMWRGKGQRAVTLQDCLLDFHPHEPRRVPWQDIQMKLKLWSGIHNKTVKASRR